MLNKLRLILTLVLSANVHAAEQVPVPPPHVVLKPTFMTGYDSFSGGTAFVCSIPQVEGTFLLTAQHLFGPACGLEQQLDWREVPKTYVVVTALSISDPTHYLTSTHPVTIPGAHALDNTGYDRDLAAYRVASDQKLATLALAARLPKVGDPVFLHARQRGGTALELFRAVVRKSSDTEFEYTFDAKKINLAGTSGAPVLNLTGEVVALNIGGGDEGGKLIGFGNPCTSISKLLKSPR